MLVYPESSKQQCIHNLLHSSVSRIIYLVVYRGFSIHNSLSRILYIEVYSESSTWQCFYQNPLCCSVCRILYMRYTWQCIQNHLLVHGGLSKFSTWCIQSPLHGAVSGTINRVFNPESSTCQCIQNHLPVTCAKSLVIIDPESSTRKCVHNCIHKLLYGRASEFSAWDNIQNLLRESVSGIFYMVVYPKSSFRNPLRQCMQNPLHAVHVLVSIGSSTWWLSRILYVQGEIRF